MMMEMWPTLHAATPPVPSSAVALTQALPQTEQTAAAAQGQATATANAVATAVAAAPTAAVAAAIAAAAAAAAEAKKKAEAAAVAAAAAAADCRVITEEELACVLGGAEDGSSGHAALYHLSEQLIMSLTPCDYPEDPRVTSAFAVRGRGHPLASAFDAMRAKHPRAALKKVFHGSGLANWMSILRHGLRRWVGGVTLSRVGVVTLSQGCVVTLSLASHGSTASLSCATGCAGGWVWGGGGGG